MKKQWPYFLLVFAFPIIVILWWWGMFSSALVEVTTRGGYHYAYLDAEGAYSKLANVQQEVLFQLKRQEIEAGAQITLMQSDPRTTPYKELHAQTGFLISADVQPQEPLKAGYIGERQVVVAKIRAHPLFAYGKTYSALLDFLAKKHAPLQLPATEIYQASTLSVEVPFKP